MTRSAALLFVLTVTLAIMAAIGWMLKEFGTGFAAGALCATLFWEVVHRISKGYWFTG